MRYVDHDRKQQSCQGMVAKGLAPRESALGGLPLPLITEIPRVGAQPYHLSDVYMYDETVPSQPIRR